MRGGVRAGRPLGHPTAFLVLAGLFGLLGVVNVVVGLLLGEPWPLALGVLMVVTGGLVALVASGRLPFGR